MAGIMVHSYDPLSRKLLSNHTDTPLRCLVQLLPLNLILCSRDIQQNFDMLMRIIKSSYRRMQSTLSTCDAWVLPPTVELTIDLFMTIQLTGDIRAVMAFSCMYPAVYLANSWLVFPLLQEVMSPWPSM